MNFSQIKCFLAAAEYLSFTRAADRLYLSQPVLSRQIAAMEDELGMELFTREKKAIKLTPAGEILAQGMKRLAKEYQSLVEKANAVHRGFAGSLNIGMVEGQLICPPYSVALNRFREKYPDVRVNLSSHTLAGLHNALLGGEIDVGFASLLNLTDEEDIDFFLWAWRRRSWSSRNRIP
jgi:DNA-binding transcriptional LysR family regulator